MNNKDEKRIARIGQLIILIFFGGAGLWMTFAPLHGAVVATGSVKVESYRRTIQLNEGGIIKAILVKEGQKVAQGEHLLELEDSEASAGYGVLRGALDALLARKSRLETEATLGGKITFHPDLLAREKMPAVAELMERERRLFIAKREVLNDQVNSLQRQIQEIDKEHQALNEQVAAESGAERSAQEELKSYDRLLEKNFISQPKWLEQKRKVYDYQSRTAEHKADLSRSIRNKEELKLKVLSLRSEYMRVATEELKDTTARIVELSDRIRPAEELLKRRTVVAPVAGTVLALKSNLVGSGIGPREPLMDIVPEGSALMIEAQVGVDSIKELHLDQLAEIRFPALPHRTTPLVEGKVTYIAADAQTTKDGMPYYMVRIQPDPASMEEAKLPPLQPGMAAEVYIQTYARTALEYFIKPVSETLTKSFRER